MELKHCFNVIFFIFLLISASFVTGRKLEDGSDSTEVYEIDYRGPETHSSSFPPPDNSNASPRVHRSSTTNQLPTQLHNFKADDSNSATNKHKARKIIHV